MPTSTIKELRELWTENKTDEDLKRLLVAELRERAEGTTPKPEEMRLLSDIENGVVDERFKELDKLIVSFNTLANMDFYPAMIEDSLEGIQYRGVDSDLNKYPIDDGHTFRPEFSITINNNTIGA